MSNTPKVLYIMGTARSGSTILEILLSQGKNVFAAGELTVLVQAGFVEDKICSCGNACSSCKIWGRVLAELKMDSGARREWADLQKKVDWHDGFLRQLFHLLPKRDIQYYRKRNLDLLDAIRRVTGHSIVLDSSKYAGRALALSGILQSDLKVICLTRSPAGIMASFQKPNKDEQKPKSTLAALAYYCATLTFLRVASILLGDKVLHLRYEDLLSNPVVAIQAIEHRSGVDFSTTLKMFERNEKFPVGHLVTGNRLRKRGNIRFDPHARNAVLKGYGAKMALVVMNVWRRVLCF